MQTYREKVRQLSIDGDFDKSLKVCDKYLKKAQIQCDDLHIAHAYYYTGRAYFFLGKLQFALDYFLLAKDTYSKTSYKEGLEAALISVATVYSVLEDFENSLAYYATVRQMKSESTPNKISVLLGMASIHKIYKNYDAAYDNYCEALDLYKSDDEYHDKFLNCQILMNLSEMLISREEYKNALKWILTVETIAKRAKLDLIAVRTEILKVECHIKMERYVDAKKMLLDSIANAKQKKYFYEQSILINLWCDLAFKFREMDKVEAYLLDVYNSLKEHKLEMNNNLLKNMVYYYSLQGQGKLEAQYREELYQL